MTAVPFFQRSSRVLRCVGTLVLLVGMGLSAGARPLRMAVSEGPVSLPIYVAEAEHFFELEGVNVQLQGCSSGRECFGLLGRGEVALATAAELVVTLNSAKNPDAAIIATLSSSAHSIKLVARRDAGIARPDDFLGKRVGTAPGTSAQYFFDSWLVFNAIDPASVTIVGLAPDRLVAALDKREVDAVAIWDPVASSAAAGLGTGAVVLPDARIYTQHFNLISSRKVIAGQGEALVKLLRALQRGEQFIAAHPEQATRILGVRLHRPVDPKSLEEHVYRLRLDQSLISTMEAQARWASGQGLMPNDGKVANLLHSIEPSLLRQVSPASVDLVQ